MINLGVLSNLNNIGESYTFSLTIDEDVPFDLKEGQFVQLFPHRNDFVSLSPDLISDNLNKDFIICKTTNNKDANELISLLEKNGKTSDVFFQVAKYYKKIVTINAFAFNNRILDRSGLEIQIGVTSPQQIRQDFSFKYRDDNYFLTIEFEELPNLIYLVGNKDGKIVYLNIQTKAIKDVLNEIPEGMDPDDKVRIGEIETDAKLYRRTNIVTLRKNEYIFVNRDALSSGINQSSLHAENYKIQNNFLNSWETFSRFEESKIREYINKIGSVEVSNCEYVDNKIKVTVKKPERWLQMKKIAQEHNLMDCFCLQYSYYQTNKNGEKVVVTDEQIIEIIDDADSKSDSSTISCRIKKLNERFDLTNVKYLCASTILSKEMFERRNRAFERIKKGNTGLNNFNSLFDGENPVSLNNANKYTLTKIAKRIAFGSDEPTSDQNDAINIALQTPDFAIIQGPPGTGKTRVISAIAASIPQPDDSKEMDLYTAHQNLTTNLVAKKLANCFDFPYETLSSEKANIDKERAAIEWADKNAKLLRERNPEAVKLIEGTKEERTLINLFAHYKIDKATTGNNINILLTIKNNCEQIYANNRIEIENLYNQVKKYMPRNNYNSKRILSALNELPLSDKEFEDGGLVLVNDTFKRISIDLEVNELLTEEISKDIDLILDLYTKKDKNYDEIYDLLVVFGNRFVKIDANLINIELNVKISNLLKAIKKDLIKEKAIDINYIVANYILDLESSPSSVYKAMKKFQDKIIATHQMAGSKDAASISQYYRNVFVDEAARSNPADLLIPLTKAKGKIVLVGDQKQLPQFIDEQMYQLIDEAILSSDNKALIRETLFEYLIESARKLEKKDGIRRVIRLKTQFRMPKVLGNFIGEEFYSHDDEGNLLPEFERGLDFGGKEESHYHDLPGLENKAMVFVNAKHSNGKSGRIGYSFKNEDEAKKIVEVLKIISKRESCKKYTYGIISFYQAQVDYLKAKLIDEKLIVLNKDGSIDLKHSSLNIIVATVDSYQGEEKDIILLSTVKGNRDIYSEKSFAFLNDYNRLNVALSRAKKCCLLFADSRLFSKEMCKNQLLPLLHFYEKCKAGEEGCAYVK